MWQTIGQPQAIALLGQSLSTSTLAHAYLFIGQAHVGKTTLALDLARAVNCQGAESPCGKCQSCDRIINGKYADVVVISLDSAKDTKQAKPRVEISIDDIKELRRSASLPPYEGKYKVFIIDSAECLSNDAANCLLKTLEEPPPKVIICLLATDETRLLPTITSRCQRIELKPVSLAEVEKTIVEYHGVDSDRARLLAHLSQGCLGWALAALDDNYLIQRVQKLDLMFSLFNTSWGERLLYAAQLRNDRKSTEDLISLWLMWWRDVMVVKYGCTQAITNIDHILTLEKWAQTLSLQEIDEFINSLQKSLTQISKNANLRLVFEILMLDMPRKEEKAGYAVSAMPAIL